MKNREIKKYKQELYRIGKLEQKDQLEPIKALASEIGAPLYGGQGQLGQPEYINYAKRSIHMVLQTDMMLNACGSAKWSCFWAAIAATVACISVLLTLAKT